MSGIILFAVFGILFAVLEDLFASLGILFATMMFYLQFYSFYLHRSQLGIKKEPPSGKFSQVSATYKLL
ncbi:hypothetical protein V7200_16820 [Cytobacillus firmus]|uniref:hypothetical protein n=1 Tax=Cytobacillus firmus TaxID=1399 RepID=UPI001331B8B1|nr:hypothetical protein [Cytobacillus firmus]